MTDLALSEKDNLHTQFGENEEIGAKHYRSFVGPPNYYDLAGAAQFYMLTLFGMRETSTLLDIGCGSLRGGRFSIMYLRPGKYYGIDPEEWAIQDGLQSHFGQEITDRKTPSFIIDSDFGVARFDRKFDFMMANSIFTHAPVSMIRQCFANIQAGMVPQTIFLGTFFESLDGTDYNGDAWLYPDIVRYRKETITAIVEECGLACAHFDVPHPFNQKWICVTQKGCLPDVDACLGGYVYSYEATLERRRSETTWPTSPTDDSISKA